MTRSLTEGKVLEQFKTAHIVPIYKGGDRCLSTNYRPISLPSNVAQVMEKLVKVRLEKYLDDKDSIPDKEHGFRAHFSTLTQLVHHFDDIIERLQHHDCVDVIYLDFAKAFDKVDHALLLNYFTDILVGY
jgi:Reverse transcriptase (RNA-dependent DNA polymerase).